MCHRNERARGNRSTCPNQRRIKNAHRRRRRSCSSRAARRGAAPSTGRQRAVRSKTSIPARLLRRDIDGFPELGELEVLRHFTGLVATQLLHREPVLPVGLLHDEVQSQDQRSRGASARLRPAPSNGVARASAGRVGAALRARADARRSERHGVREFAAFRGRARRTHRFDADSRLSERARRSAQKHHRSRHCPWHQPGEFNFVRLRRDPDFVQRRKA